MTRLLLRPQWRDDHEALVAMYRAELIRLIH
jgi:hypothetical protein